jgi:DNA-binding transcriptional LysR family regulator
MDRYRRMAMLATVVESGSLRGASRELGLTPSAVSQQLRRLEDEVGLTLLRRSTRRLALTEAGAAFYEGCAAMVAAARAAHEGLAAVQDAPQGELSIGAPPGLAAAHLVPALAGLLEAHQALRLRLLVTDERVDLIRDRIDLAIVIGRPLPSSSLVRHHLADWDLGLCASPVYLARRGAPREPAALLRHDVLSLPHWHHGRDVLTAPGGRRYRVAVRPRVTSNNQHAIRLLTLAGAGLSFQALPEVAAELADGRLVRVLPEWTLPGVSVDALTPSRARAPVKVRLAIEALKRHLARAGRSSARRPARGAKA